MANTKSAIKEVRVAAAREERNKGVRSVNKTMVHKAEAALTKGDAEASKTGVKAAFKSLDKAAAAGIIHPNAAARKKSRLAKRLNKASAAK